MMRADPIPALAEADATGETAALFADLRATLGVPFVNLIWRHLATIPGGLGWTWELLRPLYVSPALGAAAEQLQGGIEVRGTAIPGFVFDAAGVDVEARAAITTLVGEYNRANALNFLGLSVACRVLRGEAVAGDARPTVAAGRAAPGPALRLPGRDELSAPVRALVLELDQFGRIAPSPAVASLYRHLGHWPGFLALAHTALLPRHSDGSLRVQQERLIERSIPLVTDRLFPLLAGAPGPIGAAERERILLGLDEFTRLMIGRMMVMGAALLALLQESGVRTSP